jgi:hypothetical protein
MKAARIIFAMYIVFLTTMPCVDILASFSSSDNSGASLYPLNSHSQEHNDVDCCSPFCVCNCCQVNVVTQGHMIITEPSRVCLNTLHPLNSGEIQEIPLPFWQPPKIGRTT